MKSNHYILSIDQGTTSSRAIIFDKNGQEIAKAQKSSPNIFQILAGWNTMQMKSGILFSRSLQMY